MWRVAGKFYDEVGALRDVVQNHLMQTVALLAMEPPLGAGADSLRDEKETLFRAVRTLEPSDIVRGQFDGYRDEPGVAPDSDIETYAAVRLHIDSWRWADVPFYIRAGKELPVDCTEVRVELHRPPQDVFADYAEMPHDNNYLRFRLSPHVILAIGAMAKSPGETFEGRPVELYLANDSPERDVGVRAAARRRAGRRVACCSRARTAWSPRGEWSTASSPTTARRTRTRRARGGPSRRTSS